MRLACSLTNGDGFAFEYATVDITPDYAAWLLRLAAKAAEIKQTHDAFYAIEVFDSAVEYGSALGALDRETGELIDSDREWVQVPDNHRWPDGYLQSVSAATVVVTADSIHWCAAAKHGHDGTYFETPALTVARLRDMFPSQVAGCATEARRYILYDHDMGDLATTTVYTNYDEAVDDASQLDNVMVLALAFETDEPGDPGEPTTKSILPHAKGYVDAGGGFCPNCRSDQIEGDSVDFDGQYCTQRMSCLDCDVVWFDVYTLSSVEPRED